MSVFLIPDIRQTNDWDCGLAATRAVLLFYGKGLAEITENPVWSRDGLGWRDISEILLCSGLSIEVDIGRSADRLLDCIVAKPTIFTIADDTDKEMSHWVVGMGRFHWVVGMGKLQKVLFSPLRSEEAVLVQDPDHGRQIIIREELRRRWISNGMVMIQVGNS